MAIRIKANIQQREIELPMGILDPKTGEVYKSCTIEAMDGNIEERVSEKKFRNNGAKIVTALLAEKIVALGDRPYSKGIGMAIARTMWTADRDFCLKEIRGLMNDEMEVNTVCSACGEKDEDVLYMSRIESNKWDDEDDNDADGIRTDEMGVLMFELPDGLLVEDDETHEEHLCKIGRIRLTDGVMEENIATTARENAGIANTNLLAATIVELEHIKIVDSYVVKAMSKRDRDYLSNLLSDNNPGPKFVRERQCSSCGTTYKYVLKLPDFFTSGTNR